MISRKNSIILDFEGFIDKPPTLCGVWYNEIFKIFIYDPDLKGLCNDTDILHVDRQNKVDISATKKNYTLNNQLRGL